jgi:hypothetical protein
MASSAGFTRLIRVAWALPATAIGLALALVACYHGRIRLVAGAVEAYGPLLGWGLRRLVPLAGGAEAITLGHVVLGRDAHALSATRAHERVHVKQYERWGPIFLPAYFASSFWALATGRHPYFDNVFEREARSRTDYGSANTTRVLDSNSNAR